MRLVLDPRWKEGGREVAGRVQDTVPRRRWSTPVFTTSPSGQPPCPAWCLA